ncbi:MAG: cytochrome b/b6 domain-containing protein, partial [Burkholderiaceae bacterium]|nr:cytochrome b/b6 domain-containing protein [Burkholderiaceae bacterium]
MPQRIYLFTRFERFWHWTQAALIISLLFTGFAIHGSHDMIGFRTAVEIHELAVWLLIALWIFAIFWHFTTGQWRHYIPTMKNVDRMVRYYAYGIFVGAPHPYKASLERKHNPLQRITYLGVKLLINPLLWISGLAYLFWDRLQPLVPQAIGLEQVATLHTLGAFLMLAFLIAHVYLATAGATP